MRHTDIDWDLGEKFNYSVTMELIISHHWRLPDAVNIPLLRIRLAHCFQEGISKDVELSSSVDWAFVIGLGLPKRITDCISQYALADAVQVQNIRLGSSDVHKALGREWYIQGTTLFVSIHISRTELGFAIQSWLHEGNLQKLHQNG